MGVDGDGGEARGRRDVAKVLAEVFLVDRQIFRERQQYGRNDAVRYVRGGAGHLSALL
jgi:hypothetical protein